MSVRGRDEREGKKGERSDARPPIMPRGECVSWSIYIYTKHMPMLLWHSSFSFLSGIPSLVGGLDFLAHWLRMGITKFTPRECSPLPVPNAPMALMIGGALAPHFLHEFVQRWPISWKFLANVEGAKCTCTR